MLPFGLNSACYCFTKVIRNFLKRWRSFCHRCLADIDDGISGHKNKLLAIEASSMQKKDLTDSGFTCNDEKCQWKPRQCGSWLGFEIDTVRFLFKIPQKKVAKIEIFIRSLLLKSAVTFREIARLAFLIISVTVAVAPIARLFTRQMYFTNLNRKCWDSCFVMSPALIEEVCFRFHHVRLLNGFSVRPNIQLNVSLHMDTSRTGLGGHSSPVNFDSAAGLLSVKEQLTSSTERELLAMYYVLVSYCKNLISKKVKVYSDNQGARRIISVGSRKPHLQKIAIDIFKISVEHNSILKAQWIPRTETVKLIF